MPIQQELRWNPRGRTVQVSPHPIECGCESIPGITRQYATTAMLGYLQMLVRPADRTDDRGRHLGRGFGHSEVAARR